MTAVLLSFLLIGPVAVAPPVAPQSVACALTGPGMPFTLRRDALIGAGEMEEALRHVEDAIGREPQCAQHRSDAAVLLHAQGGDMRAALRYALITKAGIAAAVVDARKTPSKPASCRRWLSRPIELWHIYSYHTWRHACLTAV